MTTQNENKATYGSLARLSARKWIGSIFTTLGPDLDAAECNWSLLVGHKIDRSLSLRLQCSDLTAVRIRRSTEHNKAVDCHYCGGRRYTARIRLIAAHRENPGSDPRTARRFVIADSTPAVNKPRLGLALDGGSTAIERQARDSPASTTHTLIDHTQTRHAPHFHRGRRPAALWRRRPAPHRATLNQRCSDLQNSGPIAVHDSAVLQKNGPGFIPNGIPRGKHVKFSKETPWHPMWNVPWYYH